MTADPRRAYRFTLILGGRDDLWELPALVSDALFEAGCDDASLGSCEGVTMLAFDREAASFAEAVASARAAVGKAGLRVLLVFIDPDDLPPGLLDRLAGGAGPAP